VLLYKSFGWEASMPQFAHLPLILKPSGQGKLSKRDGDKMGFPVFPLLWKDPESGEVSSGYKESGYFPEAMINILAFLGWNPGTEKEMFTLEELVAAFSLDRVGKSGARFDPEKARWYNQQYMKSKPSEELTALIMPGLIARGIQPDAALVTRVIELVRERMVFPADFWEQAWYFFQAPDSYEEQMKKKVWKEDTPAILAEVQDLLAQAESFRSADLEAVIKEFIERKGLGFGKVAAPLRLLIVGSGMGPHLFDILEMIGKTETLTRIRKGLVELASANRPS